MNKIDKLLVRFTKKKREKPQTKAEITEEKLLWIQNKI